MLASLHIQPSNSNSPLLQSQKQPLPPPSPAAMSAGIEGRTILKMDDDEDDGPSFYFPHKDNDNGNDLNSKIMLIAIVSLSVVVLLVVALHIYARYVLRRQARRRRAVHHLGLTVAHARSDDHNPRAPNKTGLDPSVIASLPVFSFRRFDTTSSSVPDCAVCLSALDDGDMARLLPNCKHTFHVECIDKWLSSQSTCPICRTKVELRRLNPEPREGPVERSTSPASAPPLEGSNSTSSCMEGTSSSSSGINSGKMVVNNSSRLSSFRRILSRERSSRRIQPCGQQDNQDVIEDLERQ